MHTVASEMIGLTTREIWMPTVHRSYILKSPGLLAKIAIATVTLIPQLSFSAPSTSTKTTACTTAFPYSAETFVNKLLLVTSVADPFSVPRKLEETYSMKLPGTISEDGLTFVFHRRCGWHATVNLATADIPPLGDEPGMRLVSMYIAAEPKDGILRFRVGKGCLTADALAIALKKDGWSGPNFLDVAMTYNKAGAAFVSATFGSTQGVSSSSAAPQARCVDRLEVTFKQR